MIDRITKKITAEIVLNFPDTTVEKAEQIDYGLYTAITDGLKLMGVLLTAALVGQFLAAVVAVVAFAMYKSYFGGVHAKTQLGCTVAHFILIFGTVFLAQSISFKFLNLYIFPIAAVLAYIYAPADLPSKPIISLKRKREMKIKGFAVFISFFVLSFFMPTKLSNVITIITLISTINLTPVVYKITKNTRGGVIS